MNRNLLTQALIKFLAGIILTGLLVFLPAGSFAYWQGWLLMGILFIPMFLAGIVMLVKSPDLLSKRLNAKEKESAQKTVVALSGLLFIISFVTAGLKGNPFYLVKSFLSDIPTGDSNKTIPLKTPVFKGICYDIILSVSTCI